jgi:hypothetical protein
MSVRNFHFVVKIVLTEKTVFSILYHIKRKFLSIEYDAVDCWKFELSFLLRKADNIQRCRSDWNNEWQDAGGLACVNGFVPSRLFCKSFYNCMSV